MIRSAVNDRFNARLLMLFDTVSDVPRERVVSLCKGWTVGGS